ncbi:MAG TPA: hypothetical protein VF076_04795 [Acidimicrobiales bacterium]
MAATISIKERNGSGPTDTTVATATFSSSDVPAPGAANPLVRPGSGLTNYSFWKHLFLNADTTPAVSINNVTWYTDGSIGFGTGLTLRAGTRATYTQATGTVGTSGNDAAAGLSIAMTAAGTFIVTAPLTVAGSIANPSTGKISDFLVLQVTLADTAGPGVLTTETTTWAFDEV